MENEIIKQKKIICFDIGATDIKYGIVEDGKIIDKKTMPTDAFLGKEVLTQKLVREAKKYMLEYNVDGVSVSCAGSIDCSTGEILIASDNAPEMLGINFKKIFKEACDLECAADNDVNCFALAENAAGYGANLKQFIMMTIGSGIGGAIIEDGEVWHGSNYNAGEFGRMLMNDGKSYESLASMNTLIRNCRKAGISVANGIDIFKEYDQKNPVIVPIVKEFFKNAAMGITNLIYIFNPEAVIIGGGVSNRKSLSTEITRELKKIIDPMFLPSVVILNSYFKNEGGMIGAYYNFINS